ncbi:hypothetical protein L2E82_32238 [Cichorium intybus]|uniref:Uncharacterized protein n=1 Tax=Cichorium intybus TaxID=13427 RepID=A0ACB9BFR8_CICIN|nr:hypothetical protein L2E82_32238 [Cichorium intybus]
MEGSVLRIRGKKILENEHVKELQQVADPSVGVDPAVMLMQEGLAHILLVAKRLCISSEPVPFTTPPTSATIDLQHPFVHPHIRSASIPLQIPSLVVGLPSTATIPPPPNDHPTAIVATIEVGFVSNTDPGVEFLASNASLLLDISTTSVSPAATTTQLQTTVIASCLLRSDKYTSDLFLACDDKYPSDIGDFRCYKLRLLPVPTTT